MIIKICIIWNITLVQNNGKHLFDYFITFRLIFSSFMKVCFKWCEYDSNTGKLKLLSYFPISNSRNMLDSIKPLSNVTKTKKLYFIIQSLLLNLLILISLTLYCCSNCFFCCVTSVIAFVLTVHSCWSMTDFSRNSSVVAFFSRSSLFKPLSSPWSFFIESEKKQKKNSNNNKIKINEEFQ